MANSSFKVRDSLNIQPIAGAAPTASGDIVFDSTANALEYYNGSSRTVVNTDEAQTLTSKTLTAPVISTIVNTGTLTLPTSTDTLVGKATTDVLTNKTLTGNTAVNLISGSGTLTLNTSGTATVPNATDTLVGRATTDTLTNKSISGATNTLSNIPVGSVTGVLPVANGGTNKNMTVVNGGVVWTDADSMEVTAAGTSGDVLTSAGAAAPVWTPSIQAGMATNYSFTTSVAASALTIALKDAAGNDPSASSPCRFSIRTASATAVTHSIISVTGALSLVVPSGATLGHTDNVAKKDYLYLINNAGTLELAIMGYYYPESAGTLAGSNTGLVTTTAISSAADSGSVMYSTTARTNVSYRLIGRIESLQTTAGTWASAGVLASMPLVAPDENVMLRAQGLPTGTLNGSYNTTIFGSRIYDTFRAYDTTTGVFTAPIPGTYLVSGQVVINATYVLNNENLLAVYVNGTRTQSSANRAQAAVTYLQNNITTIVTLAAGDTLDLRSASAGTTPTYSSSVTTDGFYFTVHRIGL